MGRTASATTEDLKTRIALTSGLAALMGGQATALDPLCTLLAEQDRANLRPDESAFLGLCESIRRQVLAFDARWLSDDNDASPDPGSVCDCTSPVCPKAHTLEAARDYAAAAPV